MGTLTHLDFLDALRTEVGQVTELLTSADLSAPVRACPGWQVGDLIEHLGHVHRWTTDIVRTQDRAHFSESPPDMDLAQWFNDGAETLIYTFTLTDPDLPCWTMAPPRTVGFWSRRQAHEALIHRWDLATAVGGPSKLDPELAVDGIAEAVDMFFPLQVRLGRQTPLTDAVAIVDTRSGQRWVLQGDGMTTDPQAVAVDATVSGDGVDLLLLLWQRVDLQDIAVQVDGDRIAAQRVLGAQLTP